MSRRRRIAIAWNGLPAYAANAIRAGLERTGEDVSVLGTMPAVPFQDIDRLVGKPVHWLKDDGIYSWKDLNLEIPEVFFVSGWSGIFRPLLLEVKSSGGKVVAMSDRLWTGDWEHWRHWLNFQLKNRRYIDAIWVPGAAGVRNARYFGFKNSRIYTGVYTAITDVFTPGAPLKNREKKLIFVGRYEPVKNVGTLIKAFQHFHKSHPDWTLETYGVGSMEEELVQASGIRCNGFLQPAQLAEKLRSSRFLVLPSVNEAWGLVVHEACCCGCGLILSDIVGAAPDLGCKKNMWSFRPDDVKGFSAALEKAANLSDHELDIAEAASLQRAALITPANWANVFQKIIQDLAD
jgi:glycosyltransferase involved in cell wall biosynthesis